MGIAKPELRDQEILAHRQPPIRSAVILTASARAAAPRRRAVRMTAVPAAASPQYLPSLWSVGARSGQISGSRTAPICVSCVHLRTNFSPPDGSFLVREPGPT